MKTTTDEQQFKLRGSILILFKSFGKSEDSDLLEIYYNDLKQFDIEWVLNRLRDVRLTHKYPTLPTIGLILDPLNTARQEQEQSSINQRSNDFKFRLREAVRKFSPYYTQEFDEDVLQIARQLGGLGLLSSLPENEFNWRLKEAVEIFESIQKSKNATFLLPEFQKKLNLIGIENA